MRARRRDGTDSSSPSLSVTSLPRRSRLGQDSATSSSGARRRTLPYGRAAVSPAVDQVLRPFPSLTAAFTPDGGLALPLSLSAGLLVVAALPQLGVKTGALHFALEAPQRAIETFIVLNDDFQRRPDLVETDTTSEPEKLNVSDSEGNVLLELQRRGKTRPGWGHGRRPSRCRVCVYRR